MTETGNGARYLIRVADIVDPCWSDRLGGLTITQSTKIGETGAPISELTGWLPDQAALIGVLNTIYNNRFELISVETLGKGKYPSVVKKR